MNQTVKMLMVAIPAAVLGALAMFLVMDTDEALGQRAAARLQPFEVRSGQTIDGFEVFYIVDPQNQQIVAVGYDRGDRELVPIGGRSLSKDFNIKTPTSFSVASTQLSKSTGLLLVVNHTLQRAIVYEVDQTQKKFRPRAAMDLTKVFKEK